MGWRKFADGLEEVVRERDKWCAKRTTSCLTAYREERSDEWCADSAQRMKRCAERTAH